jgi:hypothetical protein
MTIAEELQNFGRIIADGGKFDALVFKLGEGALQLNQLPFAEGSPVGGAEE